MADKLLDDLFYETLKDIYYAERQLLKALKKMAGAARSDRLRQAFEDHRTETETHVERLQKVFEIIGKPARGKTCQAIDGIIEEGDDVMSEFKGAPALDAGLIAAGQAAEHYEIARYGTLRQWARDLGLDDAAGLLEQTLNEESKADDLLTEIAESEGNQEAMEAN
ncbi:ferritin-like domain-containing protein [Paracoccus pacificus]|uniref:Ferritin-like domain-containing protein n=1 Tax=Paracoccus pacificus TaxID=1463598 RepID=A0ABW4R533_9RHOB